VIIESVYKKGNKCGKLLTGIEVSRSATLVGANMSTGQSLPMKTDQAENYHIHRVGNSLILVHNLAGIHSEEEFQL
jgi:hypothetical protein